MRVAMEAGDLRVPEIPLAPGEDDLDSNKNSQHASQGIRTLFNLENSTEILLPGVFSPRKGSPYDPRYPPMTSSFSRYAR
ncbi:hypothetical protein Aduo_016449 [Ancylostoma duodenale]